MKWKRDPRIAAYFKFNKELIDKPVLIESMIKDSDRRMRKNFRSRFFIKPLRIQFFDQDADNFIRNLVTCVINYKRVRVKPRHKSIFSK